MAIRPGEQQIFISYRWTGVLATTGVGRPNPERRNITVAWGMPIRCAVAGPLRRRAQPQSTARGAAGSARVVAKAHTAIGKAPRPLAPVPLQPLVAPVGG